MQKFFLFCLYDDHTWDNVGFCTSGDWQADDKMKVIYFQGECPAFVIADGAAVKYNAAKGKGKGFWTGWFQPVGGDQVDATIKVKEVSPSQCKLRSSGNAIPVTPH